MRIQTLKKLSAGTLVMQTVMSILLTLGMHGAVLAATDTSTFTVQYLKAPGQEQKYLQTANPIGSFIIQMINFLILTIGSLSFVAIVVGGFTLLTSHGNENQVTKGKDILKYAIIGLVIALTSYYITAFVQNIFYELPSK